MPFFMTDDQFQVNRKAAGLAEDALEGDLTGIGALGLWTMAGSYCQAALTDGVVSTRALVKILLDLEIARKLANRLVAAGLWHAHGHDCEVCPDISEGNYIFHDWFQMNYDRGEQVKTTRSKRKELKDATLIAQVWARDCIDDPANPAIGACRYCGREVKRADRKSTDLRPTMDHVDPAKAAGVRNVVLACWDCNRAKGQRTPEAAGMTLRPAPRSQEAAGTVEEGSPGNADAGPAPVSPTAADGPQEPKIPSPKQIKSSDQSDIKQKSGQISEENRLSVRAPAGAHRGRAGQGKAVNGLGEAGKGSGQGQRRRKRRSRRKGDRSTDTPPAPASSGHSGTGHDAGPAPDVAAPGKFGSPWAGWSGPPSSVSETTCPDHALEEPCRKCQSGGGS